MQGQKAEKWEELTPKQKAWIDYYKSGCDQTEAARRAGYKNPEVVGSQNIRKFKEFISCREAALEKSRIADMEEINTFWTNVIRDPDVSLKDKLKASELRAKAAGGFLERVELSGKDPVKIVVDIPDDEAD